MLFVMQTIANEGSRKPNSSSHERINTESSNKGCVTLRLQQEISRR